MRRLAVALVVSAVGLALPLQKAHAQTPADPVLRGQVLLADTVLRQGLVVLHRVSTETQGEVDSVRVARDGSFTVRLPSVPDPERSEVYFASIRYAGILYFGKAITLPVQLDSVYEIQAYDTLVAPAEGLPLTVQARNLFLEHGESGPWQVTDLFQVRNDGTRTAVAREGGVVWQYPLPERATEITVTQGDFAAGGAEPRGDGLAVTAPIPPGERIFMVQYTVPDPFLTIPFPRTTEVLEVMVQEPAPPLVTPGLEEGPPVSLDEGVTFRRFLGENLRDETLRLTEGEAERPPPVRWLAVVLAIVLAGLGVWAVRRGSAAPGAHARRGAPPRAAAPTGRRALIMEIALLDEEFAARPDATPEERGAYEARRRALLRRLSQLS